MGVSVNVSKDLFPRLSVIALKHLREHLPVPYLIRPVIQPGKRCVMAEYQHPVTFRSLIQRLGKPSDLSFRKAVAHLLPMIKGGEKNHAQLHMAIVHIIPAVRVFPVHISVLKPPVDPVLFLLCQPLGIPLKIIGVMVSYSQIDGLADPPQIHDAFGYNPPAHSFIQHAVLQIAQMNNPVKPHHLMYGSNIFHRILPGPVDRPVGIRKKSKYQGFFLAHPLADRVRRFQNFLFKPVPSLLLLESRVKRKNLPGSCGIPRSAFTTILPFQADSEITVLLKKIIHRRVPILVKIMGIATPVLLRLIHIGIHIIRRDFFSICCDI